MIALKTTLNGKQLCIAGTEDLCVLNSTVNAVGKLGKQSKSKHDSTLPDLFLGVGGLTGRENGDDEHWRWVEHQGLKVGDEIRITILEVDEADEPRTKISAQINKDRSDRIHYEQAKKTYLELRDKFEGTGTNS